MPPSPSLQPAVDLLEPVPSVFDGIVGTQESAGHPLGLEDLVTAPAVALSNGQLAAQPLDQPVEVVAALFSSFSAGFSSSLSFARGEGRSFLNTAR